MFTSDFELPFGLGLLPVWVAVLLCGAAIGVGLGWLTTLPMSQRINAVMTIATVATLGFGLWQWHSQLDREESRRHADFASRVAVVAYALPEGLQVTVRNANPAMANTVFLSLAHGSRAPENWEFHVEPCTERSFIVSRRATWQSIVRKGGRDWSTGADPVETPLASLLPIYGVKDANGTNQLLIAGAPSKSSPVSDCA